MKTFGEFQEAAAVVKALPTIVKAFTKVAPMVAPKLQTFAKFSTAVPVGLAGAAMLQAKRKYRTRLNPGVRSTGRKLSDAEKKIYDKSQRDTDQKVTDVTPREKVVNNILDRRKKDRQERNKIPNRIQSDRRRIRRGLEKGEIMLDQFTPTNNVGGGQIAGTAEAGDDPPVKKKKKKKKKYIYGGRGSRKMWMNNK